MPSTVEPAACQDEASDQSLLDRFVRSGDESAFAALVQRYGSLVLGTCRRVLGRHHDAEDAFQATFVILARSAPRLVRSPSLGGWLYRVAHHVSLRARKRLAQRRQCEVSWEHDMQAGQLEQIEATHQEHLLDEELRRLPEKYQTPIVLCCLEGKSRDEAARILGCETGTLKWLLERGRSLLRYRLATRGVALSACLASWQASQATAAAALTPELITTTVGNALTSLPGGTAGSAAPEAQSLANGASNSMFHTTQWVAAAAVALAMLLSGVHFTRSAVAEPDTPPPALTDGIDANDAVGAGRLIAAAPQPMKLPQPDDDGASQVVWGEPVSGVRMRLSPGQIALSTEQTSFSLSVWYENVDTVAHQILEQREANMKSLMFVARNKTGVHPVHFHTERLATLPPKPRQLAPGERFQETITFQLGPVSLGWLGIPKLVSGESLWFAAGVAGQSDPSTLDHWNAAVLTSGEIQLTMAAAAAAPEDDPTAQLPTDVKLLGQATIEVDPNLETEPVQRVLRTAVELPKLLGVKDEAAAVKQAATLLKVESIDFDRQMLIAVSHGPGQNARLLVNHVKEAGDRLVVDWHVTFVGLGVVGAPPTHPVRLVLIARSSKPVEFAKPGMSRR